MRKSLLWLALLFLFSCTFVIATDQRVNHLHIACNEYKVNLDWIKAYEAKHPELEWLSDEKSRFDQTVMRLHALDVILDGKYEDFLEFVCHQPEDLRLKWHSFQNMQNHMRGVLRAVPGVDEAGVRRVLEVAIVLNGMGKVAKAVDLAAKNEVTVTSLKQFCNTTLEKCPQIYPAWKNLSDKQRNLLKVALLPGDFGQMTHLEGGPGVFYPLKQSAILLNNPIAFEIGFFVHICQVAGAMGHLDQRSSLSLNENTYRGLMAVKKSCMMLKESSSSDAYRVYLTQRAAWLGLDPDSPLHQVLARIGAMMRLFSTDEGRALKEAFLKLPPDALAEILEELGGLKLPLDALCPSCMPAILVNLFNNYTLGSASKERLTRAIHLGLPFIARVLKDHKKCEFSLDFNLVARMAKESPEKLSEIKYTLSKEGAVTPN